MKRKTKMTVAAVILAGSVGFTTAKADPIDDLITALNSVFQVIVQALVQLNSRITALENATPNYGGYTVAFAPDGAPKNVVVSRQVNQFSGDIVYNVRSRYATSTEQISIDGVLTQRPYIANYAFVVTDSVGNFINAGNYIEAPDTENYVNFHVEESDYDAAANKTVTADTVRELWPCPSVGAILTCMVTVTESATGDIVDHYTWSSARTVGGPITVNGMTFNDIRIEVMLDRDFSRVRARGIGEILRMRPDGSPDREVIFYRANGVSAGSLAGTPFDTGQAFDGVFF